MSIRVTSYPDLRFKFTKGSWETEGLVEGIGPGKDISPIINRDTELNYIMKKWKE